MLFLGPEAPAITEQPCLQNRFELHWRAVTVPEHQSVSLVLSQMYYDNSALVAGLLTARQIADNSVARLFSSARKYDHVNPLLLNLNLPRAP